MSTAPSDNAAPVQAVLADLLSGYTRLDAGGAGPAWASLPPDVVRQRLLQLQLAEAAARYGGPRAAGAPTPRDAAAARPPQLAVIGPTQVGKSTLVNLLIGQEVAGVSPLAGYTVHAQGFWIPPTPQQSVAPEAAWIGALFPGWQRVTNNLPRERSDAFALSTVSAPAQLPPCVVWDTPDFDSLSSHAYRRAVMEVIGLADLLLLAVSKEKYADLSVWSMLRLIAPLRRSLVICVNKLNPETREVVPAALRARLGELGAQLGAGGAQYLENARVFPLDHRQGLSIAQESASPQVAALRSHVTVELSRAAGSDKTRGVRAFLRRHWSEWAAPIESENAARRAWRDLISAELDDLRTAYRRDFLDHPQRYDSFRRVTLELLRLLELPGIAAAVHRVREVVTWPARKLLALGHSFLQPRRTDPEAHLGSEERVLLAMVDNLLLRLERAAADRADKDAVARHVWQAIAVRLRDDGPALRARLAVETRAHGERVTAEIHAAADRLYQMLEKSPALLNSLRAARATADGVAIAVAIKTGGIATHDLVLAPAMLALSSMLAQGALGSYMQHAADDLKQAQLRKVTQVLFDGVFAPALQELAETGRGAIDVSGPQLEAAAAALREWERGT